MKIAMRVLKLRISYIFYKILILSIIMLGIKFVFDFYVMDINIKIEGYQTKNTYEKFVIEPRVQIDENSFEYIKADKGFLDSQNYTFENVIMTGDFGDIASGKLDVVDDKNILIFTEKPNVTIYLDKLEN